MSTRAILQDMRDLLKAQIEAVIAGDAPAVLRGSARHEQLLAALEKAELDATTDEVRALSAEIEQEKTKLQSLLSVEAVRVDFLLRLILGGGQPNKSGYPTGKWRNPAGARMLNRRT